jgi:hypothetical protein
MRCDLLGNGPVSHDRGDAVATIFESFASAAILRLVAGVVWAVDEHADPRDGTAPVIEVRLEENIVGGRVLGEIRKAELSLEQAVEKRALK